jgi:hypothetical protein
LPDFGDAAAWKCSAAAPEKGIANLCIEFGGWVADDKNLTDFQVVDMPWLQPNFFCACIIN